MFAIHAVITVSAFTDRPAQNPLVLHFIVDLIAVVKAAEHQWKRLKLVQAPEQSSLEALISLYASWT